MNPWLEWVAALLGTVVVTLSTSCYTDAGGAPPYAGLTYSGATTRPGVAACGPALYLRSLYVPGSPEEQVTCLDRGGAITDTHLDIWVATEAEAVKWGRKSITVLVLPVPAPSVMPVHPCTGRECSR
jgi:3D (Asp-Asp-Asp) domain-containing protein